MKRPERVTLKIDPGSYSKDRKTGVLYARDWKDLLATIWELVKGQ